MISDQSKIPDPRVFFAAERTLLAWIRTGLTVMAFGFVVARFGLFLDLLDRQRALSTTSPHSTTISNLLGLALTIAGVFVIFTAAWQHHSFLNSMIPSELPARYMPNIAIVCALALGLLGLLVAIYLALGTFV